MNRNLLWISGLLILIGALVVAGCSNNNDVTSSGEDSGGETSLAVAAVYPLDGSTGVPTSASVSIKFTDAVDTNSVMRNMYFSGGQPMLIWRDSLTHYGGFGMMHTGMRSHMMAWMDSIQYGGEFHWNGALDSCEFVPDSIAPGTQYLCLLYEDGMMGHHGGMMGGMGSGSSSGYQMFGFTTGP
jgi:hypothetical protein